MSVQWYWRSHGFQPPPEEPDNLPETFVWDEDAERWRQDALYNGKDQGPLRCSLIPQRKSRNDRDTPDLQWNLTNTSAKRVRLWYLTYPHFQVTFLVRNTEGTVVKEFRWLMLSSQTLGHDLETGRFTRPPELLKLKPGETYWAGFYLSSLEHYLEVPSGPGRYQLEAVLAYTDYGGWPEPNQRFLARSKPILIEVLDKAPDAERPAWKLLP